MLLQENGSNGGRVDTAGHGYGHEAGLQFGCGGKGIELDLRVHAFSILAEAAVWCSGTAAGPVDSACAADFGLYVGERVRSWSTAAGTSSRAASISAWVVGRPRLKRMLAWASEAERPMAVNT